VCPSSTRMIFFVQMILLSYLIFDCVYSSRISFEAFKRVVLFFVGVTLLFSADQIFKLGLPLPEYLTPDICVYVSVIWTGTAYCGAFCAFAIPFTLSVKGNMKWVLSGVLFLIILNTHSSFAKFSALIVFSAYLFARHRKFFLWMSLPALILSGFYYWFL